MKVLITRFRSDLLPIDILSKILDDSFDMDKVQATKKNIIKKIIHIFKHRKEYDKAILISGPEWYPYIVSRILSKKTEIIFFPYDIYHFRPKNRELIQRIFTNIVRLPCEKLCFLKADKIIHKGLENELEFLTFYEKIKEKPHYLFKEFLDKDLCYDYDSRIKLSKKDGEIHLVYVGGLYLKNLVEAESFWKLYPKITRQKLHLHIYSRQSPKIIKKFRMIEKKDPYFHYEGFREPKELIKEIRRYDYGIEFFGGTINENYLILKVGFSNKLFDYIAASLPIVVSKNLEVISEFVLKNDFGIIVNYNSIGNLFNKLKNVNYYEKINKIKKNRNKFTSSKLVSFLDKKYN